MNRDSETSSTLSALNPKNEERNYEVRRGGLKRGKSSGIRREVRRGGFERGKISVQRFASSVCLFLNTILLEDVLYSHPLFFFSLDNTYITHTVFQDRK
jgi:hypothetical protein